MNNEMMTQAAERNSDSSRVKSYHQTGRILGVAGYVVDFVLLLVLLFAGWSVALRTLAFHYSPRP